LADDVGEHSFCADGVTLRFRIADQCGSHRKLAPECGNLAWPVMIGKAAPATADVYDPNYAICGAMVLPAPAPDLKVRSIATRGCRTIHLFGQNVGEVQVLHVPRTAPHGASFGLEGPPFAEARLAFMPRWIVRDWAQPGEKPNAQANSVSILDRLHLPRFRPSHFETSLWRNELTRLSAAKASSQWQQFVLRARWN
jgi:hypothetical protein